MLLAGLKATPYGAWPVEATVVKVLSAPLIAMMLLLWKSVTYTLLPVTSTATPVGCGELPVRAMVAVTVLVAAAITETLPLKELATYSFWLPELYAIPIGALPTATSVTFA